MKKSVSPNVFKVFKVFIDMTVKKKEMKKLIKEIILD